MRESRQEYEALIPRIPFIGNIFLVLSFYKPVTRYLAVYRALQKQGRTVEEAGHLIYRMGTEEALAIPPLGRRIMEVLWFSSLVRKDRMKKSFGISVLKNMGSALHWFTRSSLRAFVFIFILAFGIRAYSLKNIHPLDFIPSPDRELGAIVRSLVVTGQFADPYLIHTGLTAHLPPIPPVIFALVYHLFGYQSMTGYIDISLIIMTNSLIYALMPWIAEGLGAGRQAGFIGGLLGAFIVEFEWGYHGEGLTAVLLGLMLIAFLRRWNDEQHPFRDAVLLGLGVGIAFHVQPALLPVFLGCLAFEIGWNRMKRKAAATGMLVLGVVLACAPWTWRNYVVFHEFFFIRSNLGLELRMGNHDGAAATMDETIAQMIRQGVILHPRGSLNEAKILRDIGEMAYMHQAMSETLAWVWKNPLAFFELTLLRFVYFWFGPLNRSFPSALVAALTIFAVLGARRILPNLPLPQRILILTPLITYPLIYYLVPYMARYRMPIDWILFLLAGIEIWHWIHFITRRIADGQTITVNGSGVEMKGV